MLDIIKEINDEDLNIWFSSIKKVEMKDNILEIEVPNTIYIDKISSKENLIKEKIKVLTGKDIEIKYIVNRQQSENKKEDVVIKETPLNNFQSNLKNEYTFEEMIIHDFNKFAAHYSQAVSAEPGKINPLFIYSKPGLGKTHMLHAIGNRILKNNPLAKVLYITAEDFINQYIKSINDQKVENFRNKYRSLDCLLIDDIQFIVAKERSEEEFFFTFNALFDNKKQIVVASDKSPNDTGINERLVSRFKMGIVADIKTPEYEARVAILNKENEKYNNKIPADVIDFIAQNIKDTIRSLKGCLSLVYHHSLYSNEYPTIDKTKEWLKDYLSVNNNQISQVKIEDIQQIVANEYGITVEEIKSNQKNSRLSFPRQIAMYIACEITNMSLPDIGNAFNKDHSTVIYAREKIKQILNNDPFFNEKVNNIINKIKGKNVS